MGSTRDDDMEHALLELVRDSVQATQAQADAGGKLAAELSGWSVRLAILPRIETLLTEVVATNKAVHVKLVELADRRDAEKAALEDKHRREGYDKGRADAAAEHAASVQGAGRAAVVTWLGSPAGRTAVGMVLFVLAAALASPILRYVDLAAIRAILAGAS